MTEREFETVKTALLEILQSAQSDREKLQAADLLLTLQDQIEAARWIPCIPHGSMRKKTGSKQR